MDCWYVCDPYLQIDSHTHIRMEDSGSVYLQQNRASGAALWNN